MQTRALAALIIDEVIKQEFSLNLALEHHLKSVEKQQDKAFVQDLCYGVFRWQEQLDAYLQSLLSKPIKTKDSVLQCLLWAGLYQICYQNTPSHAAVSETVNACTPLKKKSAKTLVNALLRRFIREQDEIKNKLDKNETVNYSHPDWLLNQIKEDWPDEWQSILEANQQRPPLALRVNKTIISRQDYSEKLTSQAIGHELSQLSNQALTLEKACDVRELPGYENGEFSVQDQAAQLAAELLDLTPGNRVLDACAAPGGKSGHIMEAENELEALICLENDSKRIHRIHENLRRIGFKTTVIHGDASVPENWWDGKAFDRILLDVPCSATGIIRRHPDIKALRSEKDITTICEIQTKILDNIWPLLRSGGKLVYSTCSLLKQENEKQIEQFIQQHSDARFDDIQADWGLTRKYGRQILPGEKNMDGFFYARLLKS